MKTKDVRRHKRQATQKMEGTETNWVKEKKSKQRSELWEIKTGTIKDEYGKIFETIVQLSLPFRRTDIT